MHDDTRQVRPDAPFDVGEHLLSETLRKQLRDPAALTAERSGLKGPGSEVPAAGIPARWLRSGARSREIAEKRGLDLFGCVCPSAPRDEPVSTVGHGRSRFGRVQHALDRVGDAAWRRPCQHGDFAGGSERRRDVLHVELDDRQAARHHLLVDEREVRQREDDADARRPVERSELGGRDDADVLGGEGNGRREVGAEEHHALIGAPLEERREPGDGKLDASTARLAPPVDGDQARFSALRAVSRVGIEVDAAVELRDLEAVAAAQDAGEPRRVGEAAVAHLVGLLGPDRLDGGGIELGLVVLDEVDLLAAVRKVADGIGRPPTRRDCDVRRVEVVKTYEDLGIERDEALRDLSLELRRRAGLVVEGIEDVDRAAVAALLQLVDQLEDRRVAA